MRTRASWELACLVAVALPACGNGGDTGTPRDGSVDATEDGSGACAAVTCDAECRAGGHARGQCTGDRCLCEDGPADGGGEDRHGADDGATPPDDATAATDDTDDAALDAPRCMLTVTPERGSLEQRFTATLDSTGATRCESELDGGPRVDTPCNTSVSFLGSETGAGTHRLVVIAQGPGGAGTCDASWVVEAAPPAACVRSSLASEDAVVTAGLRLLGGSFRDGGWAVDATCDRIEATLPGDWHAGYVLFEALDLLRVIPYDSGSHGCERFILNLNLDGGETDPGRTRVYFANMAADCGAPRGNLRAGMFAGPCCVDTGRLPDTSDGLWHSIRLEWDGAAIRILVDGDEWASAPYSGISVGSNIKLTFGSECADGDETGAVFRNLDVCSPP